VTVPSEAVHAATEKFMAGGSIEDILEAAAPHLEAACRARTQHAIDRVTQTAAAAQAKAVEMAVAVERERIAKLAEHAIHIRPCGTCEREGREWVPFGDLLRAQP
jgi:hypothetical protein